MRDFNVRQMQAYAALCVWEFCRHFGIRHIAIDELIRHLMTILTTKSLPGWERNGWTLAITGRGDPLPDDLTSLVKSDTLEALDLLLQYCVEVGIVDMYGASTDEPRVFLRRCIEILDAFGVVKPSLEVLGKYRIGTDAWGDAISEIELKKILQAYGVDL